MPEDRVRDSEELWWRVGMTELRQTLGQLEELKQQFERTLRALPPCNTCARATLLEQLRLTSHQLGSEVVSLAVLAGALKEAAASAEQARAKLAGNPPQPCRCAESQCTCHD